MKVIVVGGGAAGFFSALSCKQHFPKAEVTIVEKSTKLLSKVKISGGGRCNVTNACTDNNILVQQYPRGNKDLRQVFKIFSTVDTVKWFEDRGVKLKTETDGRIFPVSNDSQEIIDCFLNETKRLGISVKLSTAVIAIKKDKNEKFILNTQNGESITCDKVIITIGGHPSSDFYKWIHDCGHSIISPVPSLFTFNIPQFRFKELMGVAVANALIKIGGTKLEQKGPVLITHWGFSGPATIKLSAWAARYLHEATYQYKVIVSWLPDQTEETLRDNFEQIKKDHPKKNVMSNALWGLPKRLWERICELSEINTELKWGDISKKNINKLIEELIRGSFEAKGKTTFKEEFVTCGGISLKEVNPDTMESKKMPGLYFAGEVLDIDGVTGGFNFQAAWSTGWIAGENCCRLQIQKK